MTREAYNMTVSTQSESKNMTYIMHVCGQSVGTDNAKFAVCTECYDKNTPKRIRDAKDKTVAKLISVLSTD